MTDAAFIAAYLDVKRVRDFTYDYDSIVMHKVRYFGESLEEIIAFYCWYSSVPRSTGRG